MRIVFDASALVKRYIAEKDTDRVLDLCSRAEQIVLSTVCVLEILSAMNRLVQENHLSRRRYNALKGKLAADVTQATLLDITQAVLAGTIQVLEKTSLRTLDAIHVATALEVSCDLFASADRRQCAAAAKMGLPVEHIA